MLYLLGGAARSGKSAIARQFLTEAGVPYFCLDYLMMGFANGLPDSGVNPEDDELRVGALLWPVLRAWCVAMVENGEEYLIEGAQLNPQHASELALAFPGQVRACFVGYADVDVAAKYQQMRRYGGGLDDWLRDYDDGDLILEIERLRSQSAHVQNVCASLGLAYFEASLDLAETVARVVEYLRSG